MRYLLAILLLIAPRVFGAAGDVVSCTVRPDGWSVDLAFSAMDTNGTWAFGLGTNNSISGSEKLVLTVWSPGFDSAGVSNWTSRIIYGTKQIRFAYSSNAFAEQVLSNPVFALGDVTNHIALSDFIYTNDVVSNVVVGASLYTKTIGNSSASTTAINTSGFAYPLPVADWTWPGFQRETGSVMTVRAVGFCSTAYAGKPLAGIRFIVSQTNGVSVTNWVSSMTIDRTMPDLTPTGEYISDFALSVFTNYTSGGDGGLLRCNFEAVPRLGTAATILVTTNSATALNPQAVTITNLCDRLGTYCTSIAVVEVSGSDANGRVTNQTPANVNSAHYFASIRGAALQLAATNNAANGHNDPGGGIIYIKAGISNWAGVAGNITSTPDAWLRIRPYPGDSVMLAAQVGSQLLGHRIKMEELTLGDGGATNLFFGPLAAWWDRCTINSASANFQRSALWYATHCNIDRLQQGFSFVGGTTTIPALMRGCTVGDRVGNYKPVHVLMGNVQNSNTLSTIAIDQTGVVLSYGTIIYNNRFNTHLAGGQFLTAYTSSYLDARGAAIVQNVFENSTNGSAPLITIGTSAHLTVSNLLIWNNVFTGQRNNTFYNDTTASNTVRTACQLLNNLEDCYNLKSDTTGPTPGVRTNNWEQMFAVNWEGNAWIENTNPFASPATFMNSTIGGFAGMNTIEHTNAFPATWPRFVSRQSYDGSATYDWPGSGNYRVSSDAPQLLIQTRWVLPFDIEGNYRGGFDPPGAYASASPRKGGAFFGQ